METSCAADLWKETYNLYISQLSGKDEALVTETQNKATWNPELLEKTFSALRQKYSQNRFSKVLHKINALLLHIKSFGTVMDVFVQAGSMFAPLIWGTAKLVLEVSKNNLSYAFLH